MTRAILLAFLLPVAAVGQLPDAPQPHASPTALAGKPISVRDTRSSFFSYLPERTNRETLGSPWYLGPAAMAWASGVAVYRVNRANGATKVDCFVPLVAVTALAYPLDRWVWRPIAVGMFGYVTQKYVRGAIGHYYP